MLNKASEFGKEVMETAVNIGTTAHDIVAKSVDIIGETAKTIMENTNNGVY